MGGDFIIDKQGNMALIHCSTSPTDRPTVDELLTVLQVCTKLKSTLKHTYCFRLFIIVSVLQLQREVF